MKNVTEAIKNFIVENFLFGNAEGLEDEASFLEEGIIDSTGVLELVAFVEENYEIQIADEEMIPENLDSIMNVVNFIDAKLKSSEAA